MNAGKEFRHSGLQPWFDRFTTLSEVQGESSVFLFIVLLDAGSIPALPSKFRGFI
jgi:hypothetical protein